MTKQELMDKIHEAGFEPPMCYSEHSADGVTQRILYPAKDFCDDGMSPFIPYYPCEWLWEKLPKRIKYITTYTAMGEEFESKAISYLEVLANKVGYEYLHKVKISNDLHQALLELFVWCIDHGHVKND